MTRDDVLDFIDHPVHGRLYLEAKTIDGAFALLYRNPVDRIGSLGTIGLTSGEAYKELRKKLVSAGFMNL